MNETPAPLRLLVVIPTYNEAEYVAEHLAAVRALPFTPDILVVDDQSPDGTGEIVETLGAADPAIHLLTRTGPRGLGPAYRDGFRWGLDAGYEVIVQMDCDGSHRPVDMAGLVSVAQTGKLALGSRGVAGASTEGWDEKRVMLSRLGNVYVRLACGVEIHDITGGYRAWPAACLRRIDLDAIRSTGYAFQIEMALAALMAGWPIEEVPITFVERRLGESKMSGRIIWEAMWRTTLWGLRLRTSSEQRRRLKPEAPEPHASDAVIGLPEFQSVADGEDEDTIV
ncbi:MAG: polyprenol monophosphomannose synthase [Acidimicrobiia bacterium]